MTNFAGWTKHTAGPTLLAVAAYRTHTFGYELGTQCVPRVSDGHIFGQKRFMVGQLDLPRPTNSYKIG